MKLREILRADYDHFLRLSARSEGAGLWRACLSPRMLPVVFIRLAAKLRSMQLGPLDAVIRLLVLWLFRVEVPADAQIGPGFVLPHPGGIILGHARIGRDVVIFQNVTLGARSFDPHYDLATRPTLEDGVIVGAGAVVLGSVTIGAGGTVAANSLVTRDVPPRATALGVPAQNHPAQAAPA
jgi:serine O-acetyltransferase